MLVGGKDSRTLTFKVDDVLAKLIENGNKHIKEYEEAKDGYRSKVKELSASLGELAATASAKTLKQKAQEIYMLPVPQSHAEEYTEAIEMLQFTCQKEIDLTTQAFNCYIRDKWDWKSAFSASTALYNGK